MTEIGPLQTRLSQVCSAQVAVPQERTLQFRPIKIWSDGGVLFSPFIPYVLCLVPQQVNVFLICHRVFVESECVSLKYRNSPTGP